MSTIQVQNINSTDGSTAITTGDDGYVSFAKTQIGGRRNLIINGAMQVAQRGTTGTSTGYDSVDRWRWIGSGFDQLGGQSDQSTDAPDGFSNSFKITVSPSETTLDADEQLFIEQRIEAQNLQHLSFGASSAKSITLSFWVKCSETGVATILLYQPDDNRSYCAQYTISSANTWEYKTITASGDTVGVIDNNNGAGLYVRFALAAGSNYTGGTKDAWGSYANSNEAVGQTVDVATAGGNFAITGVQLEVGTVATPFEHRSYGEELALCQRYFFRQQADGANDGMLTVLANWNGVSAYGVMPFPTQMRASPTGAISALADFEIYTGGQTRTPTQVNTSSRLTKNNAEFAFDWSSSINTGGAVWVRAVNSSCYIQYDAEL